MLKMRAFTVTEITKYIKKMIGADPILNNVLLEGEISNFSLHSSKHAYFSIKDDECKISCIMFSKYVEGLQRLPKNGEKVHIKGSISIYERDGKYQLYAHEITFVGLGELHIRFEALKKQLDQEGLFDRKHKNAIPKFPQQVGVITSPTGAAIQDIISVAQRRSNLTELLIYPVRVQGDASADEVVKAIQYFNEVKCVDLILIARGGGSIEELWSFNEEKVARAIFKSQIPIITGIGHETDFTISDFVSDLRAPTPSAAAELAILSKEEIQLQLNQMMENITHQIDSKVKEYYFRLEHFSPEKLRNQFSRKLSLDTKELNFMKTQMIQRVKNKVQIETLKLEHMGDKLNAFSPLSTMKRGYSIVSNKEHVVKSIEDVKKDDCLETRVLDGRIQSLVVQIFKD